MRRGVLFQNAMRRSNDQAHRFDVGIAAPSRKAAIRDVYPLQSGEEMKTGSDPDSDAAASERKIVESRPPRRNDRVRFRNPYLDLVVEGRARPRR